MSNYNVAIAQEESQNFVGSNVDAGDKGVAPIWYWPKHLAYPLRYTAPLPLMTSIACIVAGFYGIAVTMLALGTTSILWWWWPYEGNKWRTIDQLTIVITLIYSSTVCARLHNPWRGLMAIGYLSILSIVIINETILYVRMHLHKDDVEYVESAVRCNLRLHTLVGHIIFNLFGTVFFISFSYESSEESIHW